MDEAPVTGSGVRSGAGEAGTQPAVSTSSTATGAGSAPTAAMTWNQTSAATDPHAGAVTTPISHPGTGGASAPVPESHWVVRAFGPTPSPFLRRIEVSVIMGVFARAFDVEPPRTWGLPADEALHVFMAFTAACMEMASEPEALAHLLRARLGKEARTLGHRLRTALGVRPTQALAVARLVYHGIGIELTGELPGPLRFGPCAFAEAYTPQSCWFMSAFDEGFLQGLAGRGELCLRFSCRLTEGAPCCLARFGIDSTEYKGKETT